jgi:hypothetical protein
VSARKLPIECQLASADPDHRLHKLGNAGRPDRRLHLQGLIIERLFHSPRERTACRGYGARRPDTPLATARGRNTRSQTLRSPDAEPRTHRPPTVWLERAAHGRRRARRRGARRSTPHLGMRSAAARAFPRVEFGPVFRVAFLCLAELSIAHSLPLSLSSRRTGVCVDVRVVGSCSNSGARKTAQKPST